MPGLQKRSLHPTPFRNKERGGAMKTRIRNIAVRFRRQPARLPGSDGGVRERALLGARDREAWSRGAAHRSQVRKAVRQSQ
jgi:hypothetical protein